MAKQKSKKNSDEDDDEEPEIQERVFKTLMGSMKTVGTINFDVIALLGLTAAIYTLNPQKVSEVFAGVLSDNMKVVGQVLGQSMEDIGGGIVDWFGNFIGQVVP
jgi:hypothetical protein